MLKKTAPWVFVALLIAAPAPAQQARTSPVAIDSSIGVDLTCLTPSPGDWGCVDANGNHTSGVFIDSLVTTELGRGFQGLVRPLAQRLANSGEWNRQIWIAELRYERPGPVALRAEAGYIPAPIGLANLTLRPQLNPTIAQPAELFTSLPSLEVGGPRVTLLGGIYPLGAQVSASAVHWDARVAVMDTSPLRLRRVFSSPNRRTGPSNPPRFTNVSVGGGITPFVGLRLGASLTRGGWMRAGESPTTTEDRDASIVTLESELAFRHTSLAGEWVHDILQTTLGDRTAGGVYVQGMQTLTARWFVAGRVEQIHTTLAGIAALEQRFDANEQTLGFRLTPELTLRVSHRARQTFGRTNFDHTGAVSFVWYKRWM